METIFSFNRNNEIYLLTYNQIVNQDSGMDFSTINIIGKENSKCLSILKDSLTELDMIYLNRLVNISFDGVVEVQNINDLFNKLINHLGAVSIDSLSDENKALSHRLLCGAHHQDTHRQVRRGGHRYSLPRIGSGRRRHHGLWRGADRLLQRHRSLKKNTPSHPRRGVCC